MNYRITQSLFKIYRLFPEACRCWISRTIYHPKLGKRVNIYGKVQFEENVEIGDFTYIHGPGYLGSIKIGKFCSIAKNLSCITTNHDITMFSTYPFADKFSYIPELKRCESFEKFRPIMPNKQKEITKIGNDVWIGESVTLLRGVNIGTGAVIGANSFVLHDIPPYAVAVGTPAKVIKYRLDDANRELIERTEWWDWPLEKLINHFDDLASINEDIKKMYKL